MILNHLLLINCPLVPIVIILRKLVYNYFTSEIEEQSVLFLVDEFSEGYDNGKVSFSRTPFPYGCYYYYHWPGS